MFIASTQFKADISPVIMGLLFFVGGVPAVYLTVCWVFSMPLVIDKQINFWTAMELSRKVVNMHWGSVFLMVFVFLIAAGLGVLGLCIGFLVSAPVAIAAGLYAYEDIFGYSQPRTT